MLCHFKYSCLQHLKDWRPKMSKIQSYLKKLSSFLQKKKWGQGRTAEFNITYGFRCREKKILLVLSFTRTCTHEGKKKGAAVRRRADIRSFLSASPELGRQVCASIRSAQELSQFRLWTNKHSIFKNTASWVTRATAWFWHIHKASVLRSEAIPILESHVVRMGSY